MPVISDIDISPCYVALVIISIYRFLTLAQSIISDTAFIPCMWRLLSCQSSLLSMSFIANHFWHRYFTMFYSVGYRFYVQPFNHCIVNSFWCSWLSCLSGLLFREQLYPIYLHALMPSYSTLFLLALPCLSSRNALLVFPCLYSWHILLVFPCLS